LEYTGRENDGSTGLYYYRARFHSSQLGRFISEDPIGLGAGSNFYSYVAGNPVNFRDPKGRELALGVIGAAVGVGYGIIDGVVHGDSARVIAIDAVAGAASGGLTGLSNGLLWWQAATINAGIESWRQLGADVATGCVVGDYGAIAFAGGASVAGDLLGRGVAIGKADALTERAHMLVDWRVYENLANFVSINAGGWLSVPFSFLSRDQH